MSLFDALSISLDHPGMTIRATMLLLVLKGSKPNRRMDTKTVCMLLRCSPAALCRAIELVSKLCLAERHRDEDDHRFITVFLTPKGAALVRSLGSV